MTSRVQIRVNDLANLWISDEAGPLLLERLAARYGYQGLSGEQVGVAQAEAVLEEARVDGVCGFVQPWLSTHTWQYLILRRDGQAPYWTKHFPTRLAAAQAAVARVNELCVEAEKEKLPEPEAMHFTERRAEMNRRGWALAINGRALEWLRQGKQMCLVLQDDETLDHFHCRALRLARELAQA